MMHKEMYTESVSPDKERMFKYKTFATAFSYPDEKFFDFFPEISSEKEKLISNYDRLFRNGETWLYTTEYTAENEFQRANSLADIMGFYKAWGLEPDKERPDSLSCELEFMYYIIYKKINAKTQNNTELCYDVEKKFFYEHLYSPAIEILKKIISLSDDNFYSWIAEEMKKFLILEKKFFDK